MMDVRRGGACWSDEERMRKIWNASRFCVSSLRRGHANLLCIVPILVYVPPKRYTWPLRSFAHHSNTKGSLSCHFASVTWLHRQSPSFFMPSTHHHRLYVESGSLGTLTRHLTCRRPAVFCCISVVCADLSPQLA